MTVAERRPRHRMPMTSEESEWLDDALSEIRHALVHLEGRIEHLEITLLGGGDTFIRTDSDE